MLWLIGLLMLFRKFDFLSYFIQIIFSFPKTLYFNLRYFGLSGFLRFPVIISHNVKLKKTLGKVYVNNGSRVFVGFGNVGVIDNKYNRSIWEVDGIVIFNGSGKLGPGVKLSVGGTCVFGNNFSVTGDSKIICREKIEFGSSVLISWGCTIMDTDFHKICYFGNTRKSEGSVIIRDKVWVCCNVLILKNTYIPEGCIIGAGSKVTKILTSKNSLYIENCIKPVLKNISWKK